jgi:hypothetical protein
MIPMPRRERTLIVVLLIGLLAAIVAATALAQGIDRTFFPHP